MKSNRSKDDLIFSLVVELERLLLSFLGWSPRGLGVEKTCKWEMGLLSGQDSGAPMKVTKSEMG